METTVRYSREFQLGDPIFAGTKCQHKRGSPSDPCSFCTQCLICGGAVGDGNLMGFLDGEMTVFCHPSCDELRATGKMLIDIEKADSGIPKYWIAPAGQLRPKELILKGNITLLTQMKPEIESCQICFFIIPPSEKIEVLNITGQEVHIHGRCLGSDKCNRCGHGTFTSGDNPLLLFGITLVHEKCIPAYTCRFCGSGDAHSMIHLLTGGRVPLHPKCLAQIPCRGCHQNLRDGERVQVYDDGTKSKKSHALLRFAHADCSSGKCRICDKAIGKESSTTSTNNLEYHRGCLSLLCCSNCGDPTVGKGKFVGVGKEVRHAETCSGETCPCCQETIGTAFWQGAADGVQYHVSCVGKAKCYVCSKVGSSTKVIDGITGIRHSTCSIERCEMCHQYMSDYRVRVVEGLYYHGSPVKGCSGGPRCECCDTTDPEDHEILKRQTNGKYRHTTCNGEPCAVCGLPLGKENSTAELRFTEGEEKVPRLHNKCCYACPKCPRVIQPLLSKIPFHPELNFENKKLLPRIVKRSLIALFGALKYRRIGIIENGVEKTMVVPRDVRLLIMNLVLQDQTFRAWAPIKKGIFDLRVTCVPNRCAKKDLCVCGDPFEYASGKTLAQVSGCQKNRCIIVVNGLREIMEKVFRRTDLSYYWPDSEEEGLKTARLALAKLSFAQLDPRKATYYQMMMDSVTTIMDLRPKKSQNGKFNTEDYDDDDGFMVDSMQ